MSLPKRTREHRVDEKAVSMIGGMLVDDWLVRSQEGRDYGIDLQMERYDGERPTGDFIFVQVKGTEAAFSSENEKLSGFPVKTVNYAMLFSVPFFVFYASVSSRRVKFVWLQKYVEFVLEKTRSGWRDQESVTLEFPGRTIWIPAWRSSSTSLPKSARCASDTATSCSTSASILSPGNSPKAN